MVVAVAVKGHVVARVAIGRQLEFAPAAGLVAHLDAMPPTGGLPVDTGLELGGDAIECAGDGGGVGSGLAALEVDRQPHFAGFTGLHPREFGNGDRGVRQ